MTHPILRQLEVALAGVAFPAGKDEVLEGLAASGAAEALQWLVEAMPGTEFHFLADVLSTARIALELQIHRPWPEHEPVRERFITDETLAALVRQRLLLSRQTNGHLIRVEARGGRIYLAGRTPDVPRGVMATRVAAGAAYRRAVINHLQVVS